ncbi:MAG: hypothetical protein ABIM44_04930 [candidate division WOR-3 bacterium]
MGKSGVRMLQKSFLSVGVDPAPDAKGIKQPAYVRKHTAAQSSPRLLWHQSCIRQAMAGKKFPDRIAVRQALIAATRECAARNPHPKRLAR